MIRNANVPPASTPDVSLLRAKREKREKSESVATAGDLSAQTSAQKVRGKPHPLPVRDERMFYGVLGEIATKVRPYTEADPVGVLATLLAGASALIAEEDRRRPLSRADGISSQPLLIWPLLFGRTGSGRKGTATSVAEAFLRAATLRDGDDQGNDINTIRATGMSSGEGLIDRIKDPFEDKDGQVSGTVDKRLYVVEPEFAAVMAKCRREGNTLATTLRAAWEGGQLATMTKSSPANTAWSHISIIAHITPHEFRKKAADEEMRGGTYNRFIPLYVEREKLIALPEPIPANVFAALANNLQRALEKAAQIDGQIGIDAEATAYYRDTVYLELNEDADAPWADFTERAAPYCLRLASLYAVLEGRTAANLNDMVAAHALVCFSIASAKYVLDNTQQDPRVLKVQRAVMEAPGQRLGRTQIRDDVFQRHITRKALDEVLAEVVAYGDFQLEDASTGGRPKQIVVYGARADQAS